MSVCINEAFSLRWVVRPSSGSVSILSISCRSLPNSQFLDFILRHSAFVLLVVCSRSCKAKFSFISYKTHIRPESWRFQRSTEIPQAQKHGCAALIFSRRSCACPESAFSRWGPLGRRLGEEGGNARDPFTHAAAHVTRYRTLYVANTFVIHSTRNCLRAHGFPLTFGQRTVDRIN